MGLAKQLLKKLEGLNEDADTELISYGWNQGFWKVSGG